MIENFSALYYKNPYQIQFEAEVLTVEARDEAYAVTLSQSCFYPEGGGQPGDKGWLRNLETDKSEQSWQVMDTIIEGEQVFHICASVEGLKPGQVLQGQIDWKRRFDFMQQHSSEHIFSGLVNKKHGFNNVGFHINEEEMYFDFDGYLSEIELNEMETQVNQIIVQQLPILIDTYETDAIVDLEFRAKKAIPEALRLVTIEDVDVCACCGTQVRNTSEIGFFIIRESMRNKSGVRVTALAGFRALNYVQNLIGTSRQAAALLSVKPLDLVDAIKSTQKKLQSSEGKAAQMSKRYIDALRSDITSDMKKTYRYFTGFTDKQVKHYVKSMADSHKGIHYAILATEQEKRQQYYIASSNQVIEKEVELINVALNGKGGGRGGFAQGSIAVDFATARSYLDTICTRLENLAL